MPINEEQYALDGSRHWWSQQIRVTYPIQTSYYLSALRERILPSFDNLESDAEKHGNRHYQWLCGNRTQEDAAEKALGEAEFYYSSMKDVRQSMINLYAIGLSHLFEQQIYQFVSGVPLREVKGRKGYAFSNFDLDIKSINNAGIKIDQFEMWPCIEELRLACNVVKHAEGSSFQELNKLRPDLFLHPTVSGSLPSEYAEKMGMELGEVGRQLLGFRPSRHVYKPLAGEDVFVDPDDIDVWGSAIDRFWIEISRSLIGAGGL